MFTEVGSLRERAKWTAAMSQKSILIDLNGCLRVVRGNVGLAVIPWAGSGEDLGTFVWPCLAQTPASYQGCSSHPSLPVSGWTDSTTTLILRSL